MIAFPATLSRFYLNAECCGNSLCPVGASGFAFLLHCAKVGSGSDSVSSCSMTRRNELLEGGSLQTGGISVRS